MEMYKWMMFMLFLGASILGLVILFNNILQKADEKQEAAPPPAGNVVTVDAKAAEAVYKQSCISCHGGNLEGGVGPNLQKVGAKLNAQQIQQVVMNGRRMMPGFKGQLKDQDIANLAGWLAELK